jgi:hypothetical protein
MTVFFVECSCIVGKYNGGSDSMMFWLKGHFKDRKSDPQIALILSLLYCPNDDHWIQIWLYVDSSSLWKYLVWNWPLIYNMVCLISN